MTLTMVSAKTIKMVKKTYWNALRLVNPPDV